MHIMSSYSSRTILSALFAVAVVCHSVFCFAAEPTPIPGLTPAPKDETLILQVYQIPPGTFNMGAYDGKPAQRMSPKEYFENQGILFPPGSEMAMDQSGRFLLVRQTKEQLELIDAIASPLVDGVPTQVEVEISAYRCSSTTLAQIQSAKELADSIKEQGKLLVLLDRVTCVCKSGQDAAATSLNGLEFPPSRPIAGATSDATASTPLSPLEEDKPFQPGECGTKVHLQVTVGADGETIDIQLGYRLRLALSNTPKPSMIEMSTRTSFTADDGHSFLVKAASIPSVAKSGSPSELQNVVIVLRSNLIDAQGRTIRKLVQKLPMSSSR